MRLAQFTTFNIGGPAKFYFEARNSSDLVSAYDLAVKNDLRYFILGGGSNILFADEGYDGLVIHDRCGECKVDVEKITAHSGVWLDKLVDFATQNSLTGLEFAAGIPGNIGGAVFGNAGAFGGCIADILKTAVIYSPSSGVKIVGNDYFGFHYRHSKLKESFELILSATFQLGSGERQKIADKVNEHRQLRRDKHPDYRKEGCAGSIFKNIKEPELIPAGKLLDEVGVSGMKVGGAEVFERHCNIIVNKGKATASDVRKLSLMMRQKVAEKFGIELEYEIMIIKP